MSSIPALPATEPARVRHVDSDAWLQRIALIALVLTMGLFIVAPLALVMIRSLTNDENAFVGLRNFIRYFTDESLRQSLFNTLLLGVGTTIATILLAFPYAYTITCSRTPLRKLFLVLAMLPLYAPTMLYGIGLITLFGNQGLLTTGVFGRIPIHIIIPIHGLLGITLSELLASFPPAVLVLVVALSHRDRRVYEAAESMGAGTLRIFFMITLPGCLFGLISAASIAFVLSTTDYGAPAMLAEKTNVLAMDIAEKVLGIGHDHAMGAVISLVLLLPTVVATAVEMFMRRKQSAALTARSVPMEPVASPLRDWLLFVYCLIVTGAMLLVITAPIFNSLVSNWPYSITPPTKDFHYDGPVFSLQHFDFSLIGKASGNGMTAFWDSLLVAALTAAAGTLFSFVAAYLVEKTRVFTPLRKIARAVALIPLGLPGMVLGLAFVLIFTPLNWGPFPNPAAGLSGTLAILVICTIVHYLGVSFLTASTALSQMDSEFEQVAASMAVPAWRLFLRVTVPICTPAILEIAMYYFVSAMTTVSAVIFLYSVNTPLASIAIVNLKETHSQEAAAMSVLILLSNVVVRIAIEPVQRFFRKRTQRWRASA